jgi:long-chain acyl-CoA synthetase
MATIPGLILSHKKSHPDAVALRYKQLGIWNAYTWEQYLSEVSVLTNAYKSINVNKGTVVAVYGNNVPKLIFSIAAIQALGGIVVPVHPDSTDEELAKILNDSKAEILIAEDQQQVDTYLRIESITQVKNVIYLDERGMSEYNMDVLHSYDEISSNKNSSDSHIENLVGAVNDSDIAFYLFDEHENALYKVSHSAIINNSEKIIALNSLSSKDSIVSYLPLSIPTNLLFTYVTSLASGMSLNLPESNQTIEKDLQEIGPSILYAPSFVFKHMISSISSRIESATESNYRRYMNHYKILMEIYEREVSGSASLFDKIKKAWVMLTTFAPAKNIFGLTNIKHAFVSDGVLSKVNFDFFHAIGVEIQHSFGTAVSCGCISVQPDHSVSAENSGSAMTGTEIKINDKSEVCFKSNCIAEAVNGTSSTDGGWMNSGYIGKIDESGSVVIRGRSEDVITLKSGTSFSPESIENLISCSPFVKSTMAVGEGKDSLTAVVVIDPSAVNSWADRKNIRFTGYTELAATEEVRDLVKAHIKCVNETLDAEQKVERFVVLHRTLIMTEGEVSKTMEVLRKNILKNLHDVFTAINENKDKIIVNDIDKISYEININKI